MHPVFVSATASIVTHWKGSLCMKSREAWKYSGHMSMGGEFFSSLFPLRFASVIPPAVEEVVHYVWVVALSSVGSFASSVFVCTLLALDFLGSFWFLLVEVLENGMANLGNKTPWERKKSYQHVPGVET
jgi:hypothetical protein